MFTLYGEFLEKESLKINEVFKLSPCVEAMNVTKTTVPELDHVQNMVGRFILQVPSATSRVLAWMDAGLMPMADRIR